ncbi:MAG: hypothetical protein JSV39_03195, partial [Candidatus Aenigmatarchaeota archaeon]
MSGGSPRELIIEVLRKHPEGLTITAISGLTKLHRHTVTKYLYELRGADIIYEREIGPARLCYLKDGVTKKKEREIVKRLNNRNMKSSLGQIQIIAVVLFLVLAPVAIIAAQNVTNLTENISIPLEGYITANNEGVTSNLSEDIIDELVSNITNETGQNETFDLPPNITINETGNETYFEPSNETNETVGNETFIEPPNVTINETVNETLPVNETVNVTANVTEPANETNITVVPPFVPPEIKITGILYPEQVNVSEEFDVEVEIISLYNFSENVTVSLEAPDVFEYENKIQSIPYLEENVSASFSWKVKANGCGNRTLKAKASNNFNTDSRDFGISVLCPENDTEPPSILYVNLSRTEIFVNESVWVEAKVTDNVGVEDVIFGVLNPNGELFNYSGLPVGEDEYAYEFFPPGNGTYELLFARALDTSGNENLTYVNLEFSVLPVPVNETIKIVSFDYPETIIAGEPVNFTLRLLLPEGVKATVGLDIEKTDILEPVREIVSEGEVININWEGTARDCGEYGGNVRIRTGSNEETLGFWVHYLCVPDYMEVNQTIKGNSVRINGKVFPSGFEYNVSILVLDAFNKEAYKNLVSSTGEFEFSFTLPPGGYETYIRAKSKYGNARDILRTIIPEARSGAGGEVISYDPDTDTIHVVSDGSKCTRENPCSLGDIYNEDAMNGWGRITNINNYFITNATIIVGDGESETWILPTSQYIDIRKPWVIRKNAVFHLGNYTDGEIKHGGWILSKVPAEYEGRNNSAFLVEEGGTLGMYDSHFKVFEKRASNNLIIEDGGELQNLRLTVERESNFNSTIFRHPDNTVLEDFTANKHVTRKGKAAKITNVLIINQHESPKQGENWTVRFLTRGEDDLEIRYLGNSGEELDFIGLYCGDEMLNPEIRDNTLYYHSWSCEQEARIVNNVLVEGPHNLLFIFQGEETTASNDVKTCIDSTTTAIQVFGDGSCCNYTDHCTVQDICDSLGAKCGTQPADDLYHPTDTNMWMFFLDLEIANGSYETWLFSINEILTVGGPNDPQVYFQIEERGHLMLGNLTSSGPETGSSIQTYTDDDPTNYQICDQASVCLRDRLNTSCMDDGVPGGAIYLYAGQYTSYMVNDARNNLDGGSPSSIYNNGTSCDSSNEKGGKSTAHIHINRFTMQTSAPKDGNENNSIILYVPANTTMYDFASYNARYSMEMSGQPSEPLEEIRFQNARAGIRICYADGSVRGYVGVDNVDDVRMGDYHYLIAIDSEIDEYKIDSSACGSGSNDDSYILRKSSLNLGIKDTADNALENVAIAARDLEGRLSFNVSTDENGSIEEQIMDFRKIMVLDSGYANQPKAQYTPHEFYFRKYGYKYSKTIIGMSEPISMSTVLFASSCTALSESGAIGQTGINYEPPIHHEFSNLSEAQVVGTDDEIVIASKPVTQSEHFQILNITGMHSTRLVPIEAVSKDNYTVNYANGSVFFDDGYESTNVTPVYYYGGNITLSSSKNASRVYDYMQAI